MILVTGASGRIGSSVVHELIERNYPVRVLARARSRPSMRESAGVQWHDADFGSVRSLSAALDGVHGVVLHSAPAPEQIALQERVVEAAAAAGVRRVVKLSVLGAAPDAACDSARWHWRIEQRLAQSGMEACSVRSTRTMQELLHQVPLLLTSGILAGCQGTGQVADIDARDVGLLLATLVAAESVEPTVAATGPEALDMPAMASVLSRHFHRPIRYVDCAPGDLLQCAQAAGVDRWQAQDQVAWQTEARDGRYAIVYDALERLVGRTPRSFLSFANELATSLRYANAPVRADAGNVTTSYAA